MVHAKKYEIASTFVKVMQKKTVALFFFRTRYIIRSSNFKFPTVYYVPKIIKVG